MPVPFAGRERKRQGQRHRPVGNISGSRGNFLRLSWPAFALFVIRSRPRVSCPAVTTTPAALADTDGLPAGCALIEVHVGELTQLFNSLDPTPFRERDLDPRAEEFIAGWASELHGDKPMCLVVHVDRHAASPEQVAVLREAVGEFFKQRAVVTRRRLRQLLQVGRTSLLIGVAALAVSIALGDLVANLDIVGRFGSIFRESLLIGGWVAMWRPLEVFLYDWWPIRAEARRFDRLSAMTVRVVPSVTRPPDQ